MNLPRFIPPIRQSALAPIGDQARWQLDLFGLMMVICGVAYVLVLAFLAFAVWRSRARFASGGANGGEGPVRGGLIAWSAFIIVGLTVLTTASFLVDRSMAAARDREALRVRVTAHQWWWRIAYRDPASGAWIETANELHLPMGHTARIELASSDVIHSFWVPRVSGKMDAIPGKLNVLDVTPRELGWTRGQCAEFCGLQHAKMALDVKVDRPADFDAWLAAQARPATAGGAGAQVVTGGQCAECHTVRGTNAHGRVGPDLTHVGSRRMLAAGELPNTRGALEGWIADPQSAKPGANMPPVALSPSDREAAAAWLESLK